MVWTKLKSRLLSFIHPDLQKRLNFHLIRYRKLGDHTNEFIVTVDGQKVFSASYSRHNIATYVVTRRSGLRAYGDGPEPRIVNDGLAAREIHAPSDITSSIRTYLDLDPHLSLHSNDPILKAFALIDRRIGERTFKSIEIDEGEHSLVRQMYQLRMFSLDEHG